MVESILYGSVLSHSMLNLCYFFLHLNFAISQPPPEVAGRGVFFLQNYLEMVFTYV